MPKTNNIFGVLLSTILLFNFASAGLLQSIRDAGLLKDLMGDSLTDDNAREARALFPPPESPFKSESEPSFFEKNYPTPRTTSPFQQQQQEQKQQQQPCFPGDFLCIAQHNMKKSLGNELSNSIVKGVATLITEMLSPQIARSLDLMSHAANTNESTTQKDAEARAAINAVANAISQVSSKVIRGFASFIKVSLNGAAWDLVNTVVTAAARSNSNNNPLGASSGLSFRALGQQEMKPQQMIDPVLISPSNLHVPSVDNNEIRRSSNVSVA